MSTEQKYVRLKPYNGKQHVKKTFTVFGIKFDESKGWYKVDADVAEYLETVLQVETDPHSYAAFDIVDSLEAAKAIDAKERARARRASAEEAHEAPKRVHEVTREAAAKAARAASAAQRTSAAAEAEEADEDEEDEDPPARTAEPVGDTSVGAVDAAPDLSGEFEDDMAAPSGAPAKPTGRSRRSR